VGSISLRFHFAVTWIEHIATVILLDALQRLMPLVGAELDILLSKSELLKIFYSVVRSVTFLVNCGSN
jgi:hypothetical protein